MNYSIIFDSPILVNKSLQILFLELLYIKLFDYQFDKMKKIQII